jgi:hypothetical protein
VKKSKGRESLREEAERQDVLEEKGSLDELPFTRLRRYVKEPSQVYAIRIPVSRLQAIRRLAERRKEQPTGLLREWVLERLDEELAEAEPTRVKETRTPYAVTAGARSKRASRRPKRSAPRETATTSSRKPSASKKK